MSFFCKRLLSLAAALVLAVAVCAGLFIPATAQAIILPSYQISSPYSIAYAPNMPLWLQVSGQSVPYQLGGSSWLDLYPNQLQMSGMGAKAVFDLTTFTQLQFATVHLPALPININTIEVRAGFGSLLLASDVVKSFGTGPVELQVFKGSFCYRIARAGADLNLPVNSMTVSIPYVPALNEDTSLLRVFDSASGALLPAEFKDGMVSAAVQKAGNFSVKAVTPEPMQIIDEIPPAAKQVGIVTGSSVNLRASAGTDAAVLGSAHKGDSFDILGSDLSGKWTLIALPGGGEAYIFAAYLSAQ